MNDYGLILNPATAANPPPGAEALVDRARARVADILGPPVPGGRPVHKRGAAGACHVCGETGPLTFEHMPPKSASNSHPRRAVDVETSLAHPISEFPTRGWVSMQRGVGLYATCAKCNNFGGAAYVPNYFDFTASVIIGLEQWARQSERAGETDVPDKIRMNLQRIHPGSIVRQVLFMLLTASGSEGLGARYPVLGEIVLDQVTASLPPEMALRLTLLPANQRSRLHHVATEANFDTGRERALVEVAFTPFAWLLEIGDPSDREAFDIAGWTEVPPDEQRQVELVTTIGSIVTAIGGDYRHRWEIPDEELTEADQDAVAAQRQRKGGSSACHAVGRRHLRDSIGRQTRQRTGDASGSRP